jgi:hypothetical protein
LVLEQSHELLTPESITRELQKGSTGGTTDKGALVLHKGLNHGHHLLAAIADFTESLQQRLTGLLKARSSRLLRAGHSRPTGQALAQGLHRFPGSEVAKSTGGRLPEAVVVVLQGGE